MYAWMFAFQLLIKFICLFIYVFFVWVICRCVYVGLPSPQEVLPGSSPGTTVMATPVVGITPGSRASLSVAGTCQRKS